MSNYYDTIGMIKQRLEILYQMVDQLEAGGGGGGGGTTNYNELSNKPSIAGQQLVGNKTLSDLGAATPSDITNAFSPSTITLAEGGTFPSAQRSLLSEHKPINVNDDQYYFLEETGVDYLYGSMPTSGAYPSLSYLRIMKSSFLVEFHNTGIDTVPADGSDNLITSGAVYDAVQGGGGGITRTYLNDVTLTLQSGVYNSPATMITLSDHTNWDMIEITVKDPTLNTSICETLPIDLLGSSETLVARLPMWSYNASTQPPTFSMDYLLTAGIAKVNNQLRAQFNITRASAGSARNYLIEVHGISGINQQQNS